MGGPMSGQWDRCPTVEGCGSIVLSMTALLRLRQGADVFGVVCTG